MSEAPKTTFVALKQGDPRMPAGGTRIEDPALKQLAEQHHLVRTLLAQQGDELRAMHKQAVAAPLLLMATVQPDGIALARVHAKRDHPDIPLHPAHWETLKQGHPDLHLFVHIRWEDQSQQPLFLQLGLQGALYGESERIREMAALSLAQGAKLEKPAPTCHACGALGATKHCGRCRMAHYCNAACQALDWSQGHKSVCHTSSS